MFNTLTVEIEAKTSVMWCDDLNFAVVHSGILTTHSNEDSFLPTRILDNFYLGCRVLELCFY